MSPLSQEEEQELLIVLEKRFHKFPNRHPNVEWKIVLEKLQDNPGKLLTLSKMEMSEGEPDVIAYESNTKEITFADCSAETPKGRRSICYDHQALKSRKQYKPDDSALNMAEDMGVDLMDEDQYVELQNLGAFDLKTSSWLKTPADVRSKGGALFGDRRFGRVFIYHNGAESYYGVRGFRGILKF